MNTGTAVVLVAAVGVGAWLLTRPPRYVPPALPPLAASAPTRAAEASGMNQREQRMGKAVTGLSIIAGIASGAAGALSSIGQRTDGVDGSPAARIVQGAL